jgi:hypothetical protein
MANIDLDDRRSPDESALLDPDTLDPDMHYRFVLRSPTRVAQARAKGYVEVSRADGVRTLYDEADDDGTGVIMHGSRVLMCCPKAKREARERRMLQVANARLRSPVEGVKTKARRAGVKVLEGDKSSKHEPADGDD